MPSDYSTRFRVSNYESQKGAHFYNGNTPNGFSPLQEFWKWESVYSRRNGYYERAKHDRDIGGDFRKYTVDHTRVQYNINVRNWAIGKYGYTGPIVDKSMGAKPTGTSIPTKAASLLLADTEVDKLGNQFAMDANPVNPRAGLTTSLVELKREGLPKLSSSVMSTFKKGGNLNLKDSSSDFLLWQFGWLPFVNDIQKLSRSVMDAEVLISQLYRDSGRLITRKRGGAGHEKILSETTATVASCGFPTLVTYFYPKGVGTQVTVTKTTRRSWFSGGFLYHLPEQVSDLGRLRALAAESRYLYGLSFAPDEMWNVMPWSWLVDWFVNVGDFLTGISNQIYIPNVLKYGYVMVNTTTRVNSETTVFFMDHYITPKTYLFYDLKQRRKASPFGFGKSWESFSAQQLAILAALGLSRGR